MRIGLYQYAPIWNDVEANLELIKSKIEGVSQEIDLLVLCEMGLTGYLLDHTLLKLEQGSYVLSKLIEYAVAYGIAIIGSTPYNEGNEFYNRCFLISSQGEIQSYDKIHLFTPAGESKCYENGKRLMTFSFNGIKIRPAVCYDLRFPIIAFDGEEYDLLIYVANWPIARIAHWKQLLVARAIENQVYTIGVNRTGSDANGYNYNGQSLVVDYNGTVMRDLKEKDDYLEIVNIDFSAQSLYRLSLPFRKDRG